MLGFNLGSFVAQGVVNSGVALLLVCGVCCNDLFAVVDDCELDTLFRTTTTLLSGDNDEMALAAILANSCRADDDG